IISFLLKNRSDLVFFDDYHFTYEQWQGAGLTSFKIENFFIVTPWDQTEAAKGELKIILDPGVVFGTGFHPTTRDCLKAMVYLRSRYPWEKVMDFGTGTGILAIAAALLGSKEVLAVDLNPLSVKTAKKNVSLNHLEEIIEVIEGRVENFVNEDADLVVANIHYEVIRKILENKGFREKGWFIISGLMRSQVQEVKWQMEKYDLQVIHEWDNDMTWYTILAKNGKLVSLH
ncbi:MAG: 50S ribosomal protein L11 methyltransferase, partial [Deltaproteobacteria bacterium]|nr:50S ribosomal protein L11 methyltransferase [Deltaproteobacteria bacterium]